MKTIYYLEKSLQVYDVIAKIDVRTCFYYVMFLLCCIYFNVQTNLLIDRGILFTASLVYIF